MQSVTVTVAATFPVQFHFTFVELENCPRVRVTTSDADAVISRPNAESLKMYLQGLALEVSLECQFSENPDSVNLVAVLPSPILRGVIKKY